MLLLLDRESALGAIPTMLPAEPEKRLEAFNVIRQVMSARGKSSAEDGARLARLEQLFGCVAVTNDFITPSIVPAAGGTVTAS